MVKHAILLADREWCEAASAGRVKVYDFMKQRKRGIHSLGPGSVCVIVTRAKRGQPSVIYGEFEATEVKEVDASGYNRMAREGLIHNPQTLRPDEKRWVITFNKFREYRVKVPRSKLTDVRTSRSRKPISEWVLIGLRYIDDQALEGIRRKAGFIEEVTQPTVSLDERIRRLEERIAAIERLLGVSDLVFPISHECVELMLLELGRVLGFETYTADPSMRCGERELRPLTNLDARQLPMPDKLRSIDVIWRGYSTYYLFEVVLTTDVRESLLKFSEAAELNARFYIVSDEKSSFERAVRAQTFSHIRNKTFFIGIGELLRMYYITKLWKCSVETLELPYLGSVEVGENRG